MRTSNGMVPAKIRVMPNGGYKVFVAPQAAKRLNPRNYPGETAFMPGVGKGDYRIRVKDATSVTLTGDYRTRDAAERDAAHLRRELPDFVKVKVVKRKKK